MPIDFQYRQYKENEKMYREVNETLGSLKKKLEELRRYL